jgi:predicted Zn-dependent protease
MSRKLSTADVARILGMKEARVREMVRSGLCRPTRQGRGYGFSFQDLVVLRTAQGLMQRKIPAMRVRRALVALVRELPDDRPLSGLRIFADGRQVAVRHGDATWQPETGQTLLNFDVDELTELVEKLRGEKAGVKKHDRALQARQAFERALDLEDEDTETARTAYVRALELDPELVDAYVNLARLEHESGDARQAVRLYHLALEYNPDDPIVHFNLALALEDVHGATAAVSHYERALQLDPSFADAHFNLAGLCEQLGRRAEALQHYHAYKKLTET